MSQEQIDSVIRGFEAFNRGDWDAALEGFAEDVVQTAYFAPVAGERSLYGRAAIKRAWEAASEVFGGGGTYRVEPQDFRDLGGGVILVPVRLSGRGTASGVETETEIAQLWTIRQGRVVRIDQYPDVAEALEATGLSE
jgi:ketosteroid isomerase-like protein